MAKLTPLLQLSLSDMSSVGGRRRGGEVGKGREREGGREGGGKRREKEGGREEGGREGGEREREGEGESEREEQRAFNTAK